MIILFIFLSILQRCLGINYQYHEQRHAPDVLHFSHNKNITLLKNNDKCIIRQMEYFYRAYLILKNILRQVPVIPGDDSEISLFDKSPHPMYHWRVETVATFLSVCDTMIFFMK